MKDVSKSDMDYLHLLVFIKCPIYLIFMFFFWNIWTTWLLRIIMLFLRKLRNRIPGLNYVIFSEKIET